jgi:hypothetical protein
MFAAKDLTEFTESGIRSGRVNVSALKDIDQLVKSVNSGKCVGQPKLHYLSDIEHQLLAQRADDHFGVQ